MVIGRALTRELQELTGHLDIIVEHFPDYDPVGVSGAERERGSKPCSSQDAIRRNRGSRR